MHALEETRQRLTAIPDLTVSRDVPLSRHTRFGVGGPAALFAETARPEAFVEALRAVRAKRIAHVVIGGGTNLIVSDDGFDGVVLRFTGRKLEVYGNTVLAEAGAELQALVDLTIEKGLAGLETMTGIPGSVGAAIYGNAGAYGRSISESVREVRFFDGEALRSATNEQCEFRYRESVFKRHKDWIVFSTRLDLRPADCDELRRTAREIREVRDRKYPPEMRCAGSIFKNLLVADLPERVARDVPPNVIREGKVPSGYFLEQAGAKGLARGDMKVAAYHGNLIYNDGKGTARELCELIGELKGRVRERFGLELEEEVQYVGFCSGD